MAASDVKPADHLVETPTGLARARDYAPPGPRATLVMGHGAAGGIEARDLQALAQRLPAEGIRVLLVEQPWRVAGKKTAPLPARLDEAWIPLIGELGLSETNGPLFVGGRSAGARVACRTASEVGASGVVALAFPLHPPGKPERSRLEELAMPAVPVLVVQGTRDSFGTADELREAAVNLGVRVVPVADADHGFRVPASASTTQAQALSAIAEAVASFIVK